MKQLAPIIALTLLVGAASAAPTGYFGLRQGISLESGDSWIAEGRTYRLYGVQSGLRGVSYTDYAGAQRDCGEVSLAMLAAFIRDASPACAPVAQAAALTYVACYGVVAGNRTDLGTMLITSGFAFAALDASELPVHPAYAVIEQDARDRHAGLWQFDDVQHPAILLSRPASERNRKTSQ